MVVGTWAGGITLWKIAIFLANQDIFPIVYAICSHLILENTRPDRGETSPVCPPNPLTIEPKGIDMTNNPKPIDVLRDGALKASLWYHGGDRNGPFITVSLAKTYSDIQGRPADSTSFVGTELLRLSHLLTRAYDRSGHLLRQFRNAPDQPDLLDHGDAPAQSDGMPSRTGRDFQQSTRQRRAPGPR